MKELAELRQQFLMIYGEGALHGPAALRATAMSQLN